MAVAATQHGMEVEMSSRRLRYARLVPSLVAAGSLLTLLSPSGAAAVTTVGVQNGTLTAFGEAGGDSMSFSDENDPTCPGGPPCYELGYYGGSVSVTPPCVVRSSNGYEARIQCPRAGVDRIRAVGREGSDYLLVSEFAFGLAIPGVLEGGGDRDELTGSDRADRLLGGDGDDELDGRRGGDVLRGQVGADRLDGARGRDTVVGGFGPDLLIGGTSADLLLGGAGKDELLGQQGRDRCDGGAQRDTARSCERRRRIR
jgi:Ca2+-binding RTX toxin-like protein